MNKNTNNNSKYFRTSSFYVAVFLFAKGIELVSIDKITDSKRAYFVFIDSPEREILSGIFSFSREDDPKVMIDARKFVVATKELKQKLYEDI